MSTSVGFARLRPDGPSPLLALAALATALCPGCDEKNPDTLTVKGVVSIGEGAIGAQVEVRGYCGSLMSKAVAGDDGTYEIDVPRSDCEFPLVAFEKEAFMPLSRFVRVAPDVGTAPMDVALTELYELLCGTEGCVGEENPQFTFDREPVVRGWVGGTNGRVGMEGLPGEFRTTSGGLVTVLAATYYDLRDEKGNRLARLSNPEVHCIPLAVETYDEVQNQHAKDENGTEALTVPLFTFEERTGRWKPSGAGFLRALHMEDNFFTSWVAYTPEMLSNVRANLLKPIIVNDIDHTGVYVCNAVGGSGLVGIGYAMSGETCINLHVENQCGDAEEDKFVEAHGRDLSYYTFAWTDANGDACLSGPLSEPVGRDLNSNDLDGETRWLDVQLQNAGVAGEFPALTLPIDAGSCSKPQTCRQLTSVAPDSSISDCGAVPGPSSGAGGTPGIIIEGK